MTTRHAIPHRFRVISFAGVVAMTLTGCSSFSDWDPFKQVEPPLPGERIAILADERSLQADVAPGAAQIILPAPTPNADWPMAGGYANHAMHHIAVRDNLDEVWSNDIGSGADDEERFVAPPIIAGGRVFAMDTASEVSAYQLDDGDNLWSVELALDEDDEGHIGGGLAHEEGRIFVATGFGDVVALDATNGEILWRESFRIPLRVAPAAWGGRVFVTTVDNTFFALDGRDGSTLWTHSGTQEVASLLGGASPAVEGTTVLVPYSSGEIYALDTEDGDVLWQDNLISVRRTDAVAALSQIRGRPIIDRGLVIAMSNAGVFAAIDFRTGRRVWARDIGGLASPWVAGDYIFALTNESEIIAVQRNDGQVQWVRGLPRFVDPEDRDEPIVWSGPILVGDRLLIVGSHGDALAISPYDGRILGAVELPDGSSVPPVVANGTVVFLSDDAELVAYR